MVTINRSCLFAGSPDYPIYVDRLRPHLDGYSIPVVMIHGACNTGTCFLVTPDGRPGWAVDFAGSGFDTYVLDWPGHGRSAMRANFLTMSTRDVRDSVAELLRQIGPAVLIAHSAAGPIAWSLAEQLSHLVAAVIGISPGPPANLVDELPDSAAGVDEFAKRHESGLPIYAAENELFWVDRTFVQENWFAGSQSPAGAAESFLRSVVPESPRVINERFNISGSGLAVSDPSTVARRPILILTGDSDPRHPRAMDQRTAELFNAEFVWLPDRGIVGNGHMLMSDRNSQTVSNLAIQWLRQRLGDRSQPAPAGRSG